MASFHLYMIKDHTKLTQFIDHCKARIEHFTSTGSQSGVKYWKQRLDQGQHVLEGQALINAHIASGEL